MKQAEFRSPKQGVFCNHHGSQTSIPPVDGTAAFDFGNDAWHEKIQKCSFRTQRCLVDPIHNEKSIHQIWFFGETTKNEASQRWFHWSLGRYVLSDFGLWSSTVLPRAQDLRQSSQQLQQNFLLVKLCPFKISIPVHSMPKESIYIYICWWNQKLSIWRSLPPSPF